MTHKIINYNTFKLATAAPLTN